MYEVKTHIEAPLNKQHPQKIAGHAILIITIKSGIFMSREQAISRANDLAKMAENDPYFESYEVVDETI